MEMVALHPRDALSYGDSNQIRPAMRYCPPSDIQCTDLADVISQRGGDPFEPKQLDMMFGKPNNRTKDIYYVGNLECLRTPAVAIVGTRNVSPEGAARARKLARGLSAAGVAVVSGLADGVDTVALTEALACGGRVAAVIGTPLDKAYPAKNAALQEEIYSKHLLISQFPVGERTFKSNFPARNRVMAAVTDATVVIEASDSSGTLHQSAECQRLGRWLFIAKSVVDNPDLTWPSKFRSYEKCVILESVEDVLSRVSVGRPA